MTDLSRYNSARIEAMQLMENHLPPSEAATAGKAVELLGSMNDRLGDGAYKKSFATCGTPIDAFRFYSN